MLLRLPGESTRLFTTDVHHTGPVDCDHPDAGTPMSNDLREQLMKAGLVSKGKAKHVKLQQQHKQHLQKKGQKPVQTEAQTRAAQAQAHAIKVARDRELDRERQARADARARAAEITQLIEQNRLPVPEGDEYFNFVAEGKVRRIAVDAALRGKLARGQVVIVRHEGKSALVPADVAARIGERDASALIAYDTPAGSADADDPYKDFVVPEDLQW